ncbi:hypothetical protein Taro_053657, partial [Colocasia esculenta]|nr:hypothetical protein [Colocasia esculenta]
SLHRVSVFQKELASTDRREGRSSLGASTEQDIATVTRWRAAAQPSATERSRLPRLLCAADRWWATAAARLHVKRSVSFPAPESVRVLSRIFLISSAPMSCERPREVQHLIEKCIIFHMSKEECMEALSKHANIDPVITSTVWVELAKENRAFFESYAREMEERASLADAMERIQKMLSDFASKPSGS